MTYEHARWCVLCAAHLFTRNGNSAFLSYMAQQISHEEHASSKPETLRGSHQIHGGFGRTRLQIAEMLKCEKTRRCRQDRRLRLMRMLKMLAAMFAVTASLVMAQSIPSGTTIRVRSTSTISSKTAHSGDKWSGTLASDVKSGDKVIARRGDPVEGTITEAESSGRLSKPGKLTLEVTSVNGKSVTTNAWTTEAGSHKKRNAGAIGGGAALGAIIGGIAGGGKGAAIGAGAGAGTGTAGAAATGKKEVEIPSETVMTFTVS
jgi:hypothetical protein